MSGVRGNRLAQPPGSHASGLESGYDETFVGVSAEGVTRLHDARVSISYYIMAGWQWNRLFPVLVFQAKSSVSLSNACFESFRKSNTDNTPFRRVRLPWI